MQTFYQLEERAKKYPELTRGVLVKTSSHRYEELTWEQLPKKVQRDLDWSGSEEESFLKYQNRYYALSEFQKSSFIPGWEGIYHDSFFSGVCVAYDHETDLWKVGTFFDCTMDPLNPKKGVRVKTLTIST